MEAVSKELYDLTVELQSLKSLKDFALAGGTSLAIRYNHRISVDIDLLTNKITGKSGLELIQAELRERYKNALLFCELINAESGDQYCFLRALINKNGKYIKTEFLQNIQQLYPVEIHQGIRTLSLKDIGLLKLMSASSRKAKKDIYDLDYITDEIPLSDLLDLLKEKQERFNREEYKCLFDLDNEPSPAANISLLLEFDNIDYSSLPLRPSHSNDRIDIVPSSKSWLYAKSSWRGKVKDLMKKKGIPLPKIKPIN